MAISGVGPPRPSSTSFAGSPAVGALFSTGSNGKHSCSGSVVASPGGDLLVTAAHCVAGTGSGLQFVPGYVDGSDPYGVWTVVAAYADPSWVSDQDPLDDYAVLQVAPRVVDNRTVDIEDVVGADVLGTAPPAGAPVTVQAYAEGSGDRPISCTSTVRLTGRYPTFTCSGYVNGTSGGPWLRLGTASTLVTLVGVVGGLNQGGCTPGVSYSAPFTADTVALLRRAATGADPDTLPTAGSSGCG